MGTHTGQEPIMKTSRKDAGTCLEVTSEEYAIARKSWIGTGEARGNVANQNVASHMASWPMVTDKRTCLG